jgi:hypothetical protein
MRLLIAFALACGLGFAQYSPPASSSGGGTVCASSPGAGTNGYILEATSSANPPTCGWFPGSGSASLFTSYQFGSQTAITATGTYLQTTYPNIFSLAQTGSGTSGSPYVDAISLVSQSQNYVWAGGCSGGSAPPSFRALCSADIPNNAANTSGTAANLSGTPALPNGTTGTTQSQADNSTKLATTAYADAGLATKQATLTGTGLARNTGAASELSGDCTTS